MTDTAPWNRYTAKHLIHIVGEFENEHAERFIVYRNGNAAGEATGDKLYLTGDELDWQPKIGLLWIDFLFSAEERDKIAKILWPNVLHDCVEELAMRPSVRKILRDEGLLEMPNRKLAEFPTEGGERA